MASRDRHNGSLWGVAVCDALGAPLEFSRRRGARSDDGDGLPLLIDMEPAPRWGTPSGTWTDDTSLTLALAESLATHGRHDAHDALSRYALWWKRGRLSATGACVDIGGAMRRALIRFLTTGTTTATVVDPENDAGNGSLMRVAPAGLLGWRDSDAAAALGSATSVTTHAAPVCALACASYAALVSAAVRGEDKASLAARCGAWGRRVSTVAPDLSAALMAASGGIAVAAARRRSDIQSTGYVVHTLDAALWAFFATATFEAGAIAAVNLGDDADTVGAVYGGLAGAHYGATAIPRRWSSALVQPDLIADIAQALWERAVGDTPPPAISA